MAIVGIDLGTTNSAIATVNEFGKPELIPNKEGERITSSVVLFDKDKVIVGAVAKQSAIADPENTISFIKSEMGSQNFLFEHNGSEFNPEDISAMILRKLIDDAEDFLNQKIEDVVITVPAYFNDKQRKATIDAGVIAGVNVLQIVNEPTAAALTFGVGKNKNQTIMVYDLGGGTFDVTIMKIHDGKFDVIASDGDRELGGKNFDEKIMNFLNDEFKKEFDIDLLDDLILTQDLRYKAEEAKKTLSSKLATTCYLSAKGKSKKIEFKREDLNELISDHIARTELLLDAVLGDAGMDWGDIDQVLPIGGSTRIPAVTEMIKRVSKIDPALNINPDEAVALGAAIQAGIIKVAKKNSNVSDMVRIKFGSVNVADVTAHSFGAITLDENNKKRNAVIIPKNSKIPISKSQIFYTTVINQTSVKLTVIQGEDTDPEYCTIIGTTVLNFPPKPLNSPIIFNYKYDSNGIIFATAKDPDTGDKSIINITREGQLSGDEVKMKTDQLTEFLPKRKRYEKINFEEDSITKKEEDYSKKVDFIPEELPNSDIVLELDDPKISKVDTENSLKEFKDEKDKGVEKEYDLDKMEKKYSSNISMTLNSKSNKTPEEEVLGIKIDRNNQITDDKLDDLLVPTNSSISDSDDTNLSFKSSFNSELNEKAVYGLESEVSREWEEVLKITEIDEINENHDDTSEEKRTNFKKKSIIDDNFEELKRNSYEDEHLDIANNKKNSSKNEKKILNSSDNIMDWLRDEDE